jgi:thiol-disulfide isomerase/thioredoxin
VTRQTFAIAAAVLLAAPAASAQRAPRGITGAEAPSWGVSEWINLPRGTQALDIDDLRGKVVYLLGFQTWCPGCHSRGLPTLKQLISAYEDADDVAFVAVQTVFEGYSTNTAQGAWETARRYELEIPVGHDGSPGRQSVLMGRYRTGGTPWVVIIDKQGTVRFNDYHIPAARARQLIDGLRGRGDELAAIRALPPARGGQDLVGKRFPELKFNRWIPPQDPVEKNPEPVATLYRWWTDTCPYCRASLPAVELLRRDYGAKGLRVVGVYHPKPPRDVDDEAVQAAARRLGFDGPIAVDDDWSALDRAYRTAGRRRATSVSLLVDGDGVIRFVHPGPVFFPSDDPEYARQDADYRLLRQAIEALVGEAVPQPEPRENRSHP